MMIWLFRSVFVSFYHFPLRFSPLVRFNIRWQRVAGVVGAVAGIAATDAAVIVVPIKKRSRYV